MTPAKTALILHLLSIGCTSGCTANEAYEQRLRDTRGMELVPQRVTATVRRQATALVHLEVGHENLIATPEHPFATPQGWTAAGRLAPGDRIASAKIGMALLSSVQREEAASPVPVFNLSVEPSHAYLVGTQQLLVHNRKCGKLQELIERKTKEIAEARRELEELERTPSTTPEQEVERKQRITAAQSRVKKLRANLYVARSLLKKRFGVATEPVDPVAQNTQALQAVEQELAALERPGLPPDASGAKLQERIAQLNRERARLMHNIVAYRYKQKQKAQSRPAAGRVVRRGTALLKKAEADLESLRKELAGALNEVGPNGASKRGAAPAARLRRLLLDYDLLNQILDWERQIAALEARLPSTDTERLEVEQVKRDLRTRISEMRQRRRARAHMRQRTQDPEWRKQRQAQRRAQAQMPMKAAHFPNTSRIRQALDLLQEDLAVSRQEPPSPARDGRIEHLSRRIEAMQELLQLREQIQRTSARSRTARRRRAELLVKGESTLEIEQRIARLAQELTHLRTQRIAARLREALLRRLDASGWTDGPSEARLHELEHELAQGIQNQERLAEMEHELSEIEPLDADFFEQVWREAAEGEGAHLAAQEGQPMAAELHPLMDSLQQNPSPDRQARVASSLERLQDELRAQRAAAESADTGLAEEYARLTRTLERAGSSHHGGLSLRLQQIREERTQLRVGWRQRIQARLAEARRQLEGTQRGTRAGAALERQIALLEYEEQNPSF